MEKHHEIEWAEMDSTLQVGVNRDTMLCVRPVQLGGLFYKISWTTIGIV